MFLTRRSTLRITVGPSVLGHGRKNGLGLELVCVRDRNGYARLVQIIRGRLGDRCAHIYVRSARWKRIDRHGKQVIGYEDLISVTGQLHKQALSFGANKLRHPKTRFPVKAGFGRIGACSSMYGKISRQSRWNPSSVLQVVRAAMPNASPDSVSTSKKQILEAHPRATFHPF